jgi:endonuclease-3
MEKQIREMYSALLEEHGEPPSPADMPPVDYIILTILSQNTMDENRDRAWESLVDEFNGDYKSIEEAEPDRLADIIRVAGLPNQKSSRIQHALSTIREYTGGEYSLDFIDEMETDEAQQWLTNIKGIGPKTAAIVLLFCFEKPVLPVDTHCERVAKRFQLIPESTSTNKAHELLTEKVPDELIYPFHRLLITHGREYCSARNPDCDNPVCNQYCRCEYC